MSKKIMQINITCGVGSTGRISKVLYETAIREGYEACFAYSAYETLLNDAFRIETKVQNIVRRGANRFLGKRQIYSTSGTRRLIRYIKKEKPDLIHIHNVQQNSVNYLILFKFLKEEQIPVVYTLHDCWAFTGGCFHFTKIGCAQYKQGCTKCAINHFDDVAITARRSYESKQEYIGKNENLYVTCVSKWLCGEARQSYMGKMKHLPQVIYNGINTSIFYPRETSQIRNKLGIMKNEFIILGVASFWNEDKGLRLLLEMIQKLPRMYKLILIGAALEQVVAMNDSKVLCVARTESTDELAEYYSMADVFINASIEETFGLTTAEALACGTPAIVFDSTACPEIINEKTGICVEHDVDKLVEAVDKMAQTSKTFYTDLCVARIREYFSEEKMIKSYFDLYKEILNDKQEKGCCRD